MGLTPKNTDHSLKENKMTTLGECDDVREDAQKIMRILLEAINGK